MNEEKLQNKSLVILLGLVTAAFIWILLPFYGAVFWAVILGILFAPCSAACKRSSAGNAT